MPARQSTMPAPGTASTVAVRILNPVTDHEARPLDLLLGEIRDALAARHVRTFRAAGATDVRIVASAGDETPFGRRLQRLRDDMLAGDQAGRALDAGLVVLGSGSVPLLRPADARRFLEAACAKGRYALANNRFSADIVAIACAAELPELPDLPSDNALPRWLAERAGWTVDDLAGIRRLACDIDSPLDALLLRVPEATGDAFLAVRDRMEQLAAIAADPRAELVVVGRTSSRTIAMLERRARCRVRAIVEERGMRASSGLAQAEAATDGPVPAVHSGRAVGHRQRAPRSVLGLVLDRDGPEALGRVLAELGDGAVVDGRVLLAHRFGLHEGGLPSANDRFASDLLDAKSIADPWLRALTSAVSEAAIPILLGGHSLVGPGLGIALGLEQVPGRPGRGIAGHV